MPTIIQTRTSRVDHHRTQRKFMASVGHAAGQARRAEGFRPTEDRHSAPSALYAHRDGTGRRKAEELPPRRTFDTEGAVFPGTYGGILERTILEQRSLSEINRIQIATGCLYYSPAAYWEFPPSSNDSTMPLGNHHQGSFEENPECSSGKTSALTPTTRPTHKNP